MSEFTITRKPLGSITAVTLLSPTNSVQIEVSDGVTITTLEFQADAIHQRPV